MPHNLGKFTITNDEIPSLHNLLIEGVRYDSGSIAITKIHTYVDQFHSFLDITIEALNHEVELSKIRETVENWFNEGSKMPLPKDDYMTVAKRFMEIGPNELEA